MSVSREEWPALVLALVSVGIVLGLLLMLNTHLMPDVAAAVGAYVITYTAAPWTFLLVAFDPRVPRSGDSSATTAYLRWYVWSVPYRTVPAAALWLAVVADRPVHALLALELFFVVESVLTRKRHEEYVTNGPHPWVALKHWMHISIRRCLYVLLFRIVWNAALTVALGRPAMGEAGAV